MLTKPKPSQYQPNKLQLIKHTGKSLVENCAEMDQKEKFKTNFVMKTNRVFVCRVSNKFNLDNIYPAQSSRRGY